MVQVVFTQKRQTASKRKISFNSSFGTNNDYAVSKIAGVKLCESYNRRYNTDYICLATKLFGLITDDTEDSFLPAIIKKLYTAKK